MNEGTTVCYKNKKVSPGTKMYYAIPIPMNSEQYFKALQNLVTRQPQTM